MRKLISLFFLFVFWSCKKDVNPGSIRLTRTEARDYHDSTLFSDYQYDNQGRIISISEQRNTGTLKIAVTVSYNGNEVIMQSNPATDPFYTLDKTVHLTLGTDGRLIKKTTYVHRVLVNPVIIGPPEGFFTDTSYFNYDNAGLLSSSFRSGLDSSYTSPDTYSLWRFTYSINYTNSGNNLTASEDSFAYNRNNIINGVSQHTAGNIVSQTVYGYTRAFPNKIDFRNAAVLSEYWLDYFSFVTPLSEMYRNQPDQINVITTEWDAAGTYNNTYRSTTDLGRTYNGSGFLSAINVLTNTTAYRKINFIYNR